ncbi:MAG: hypothetical protein KDA22_04400, partial [Phycisphaerales bacterium]|nr:hypothetical protein [Phycisphaerales bacterium]
IAARFEPWDLVLDSDGAALAAWQVSVACEGGAAVSLVGIEGGTPAVFHEPPDYDPEAHRSRRIVLANFSLADAAELPTEPFRATTLHLQVEGSMPDLSVRIDAAAGPDGRPIPVHAELRRRATP